MRWTYYIEGRQVYPMNTRSYEIKNNLENDLIYAYRRILPDSLVLVNNDYEYLKTLEKDYRFEKFSVVVHDNGALHCSGEFTINDCAFDDYKSNCSVKLTPRDIYTVIQETEDIEVNIIADRKEVTIERYSRWHFFCTRTTGGMGIPDAYTTLWDAVNLSLFGIWVNLFVTELIEVDASYGVPSGWDTTPFADLGETLIYRRKPVDFDLQYIADWVSPPDLSDYQWSPRLFYHVPYDETLYNLINLQFQVPGRDEDYSTLWIKKSAYNNRANMVFTQTYSGMELKSSLTRILSVSCPDFAGLVKSSLLFNDTPEAGKTLPNGYPQNNALHIKYLIEMSDFRKPNASEQATKGITTWKQVIEYICQKHYAMWCIDSDGNLRIEHESYYLSTEFGLDISATNHTLKYAYLSNDKPNRLYLSESQGWNEDFEKIEVLFGTVPALNGMKESTKTISLSTIYTDIDGLNSHLSEISNDGFVLVDAMLGAVVKNTGFKSGETGLQNAALSNANCLNTYYRYNAYQQNYKIGGKDVTAISLKRQKTQKFTFQSDTIPDCTKLLVTKLGAGVITSLSYKPTEENNFNVEVIYE
jgi:hypothetical protein